MKNFDKLVKNVAGDSKPGSRAGAEIGQLLLGEIIEVNPDNNSCYVRTFEPALDIHNCIWLTKSFTSPLLGYRIKSIPSEGTKVALLYGNPAYIIEVIDSPRYDETHALSLTSTGTFDREKFFEEDTYKGTDADATLLEGEFQIENAFNVGINFLTNLISMKAGDRAKVEVHLLNDLVRIISKEFKHLSSMGETSIFNDGRPNMEMLFGSYEHELLNLNSPNQDKVNISKDHVNFDSLSNNETVKSFGHRFKAYVGFLGNFINMFISDPINNIGAMASGKAQIHVGNNGDILLRTVGEVAIERVVRVITPVRIKDIHHHMYHSSNKFDELEDSDILKKWDYGQGVNNKVHQCAYSLRSYARYLSNYASLIRFHQVSDKNSGEGSFIVPSEAELQPPDMNNKELDMTDANGPVIYIEAYSTIRIMKDGAILSTSSDGSTVYQGRGIVEISAAKDIRLESGRDISLIAGRNFFIKSKKDMELASVEGSAILKSRTLFNVLCERGKLWLKSDAPKEGEESADYGVVIDSSQNSVLVNSKKDTILQQEDGDLINNTIKGTVLINSAKSLFLNSKTGSILLKARDKIALSSILTFIKSPQFNVANMLKISERSLLITIKTMVTRSLKVRGSIFGPAVGKKLYARCGEDTCVVPVHYNHIKRLTDSGAIELPSDNINELETNNSQLISQIPSKTRAFTTAKWSFANYDIELPADGSVESLYIPFCQDYIETHPEVFTDYVVWKFSEDKLKEAPRTDNSSLPYPGIKVKEEAFADFDTGEVLDKVSTKPSYEWEQQEIKKREIQRKVQP